MCNRIKFYGINDIPTPTQVNAVSDFLKSFDSKKYDFSDVNIVLEFVNLLKFMNEPSFSMALPEEAIKAFDEKKGLIYVGINNYFEKLDKMALKVALKDVDYTYLGDFLNEFAEKSLGRITEDDFKDVWTESDICCFYLFKNKKLVDAYVGFCKEVFLGNISSIELLISNYMDDHVDNIIPNTISREEMYRLCVAYVGSDIANPKYLDVLLRVASEMKKYLVIDPDLRLMIKRRKAEIESKAMRETGVSMEWKFAIYSKKEAYDVALRVKKPDDVVALIDEEWLDYDSSMPTILNNFRYVYGLFTMDAISMLPSFPNLEIGLSDIFDGMNTRRSYRKGYVFDHKQGSSVCEMQMLNTLFSERHISLIGLIEEFYEEYCREQFGIKWLKFPTPMENEKLGNKTATLFRAEENLRKQYYAYCKKNEIDKDYVDCLSTPTFDELLSLDGRMKYAYFNDKSELRKYTEDLFSTQVGLGITKSGVVHDNLYKLLRCGGFLIDDFYDYQQPKIRKLINVGILKEYDNGLGLGDVKIAKMLYQLFYIGTLCLWYLDEESRKLIDDWEKNGDAVYDNTLFARPEIDYLNYVLNNSSFDNSLALRNKYQHGFEESDEKSSELRFDYGMAQLMHIIYMVKLNDEFVFRLPEDEKKKFACHFVDGFEGYRISTANWSNC